jgi:hypothetical protein
MISVKVSKLGTLASKMAEVKKRIGQRLEQGLLAAGDVLLDESLKQVPRDTGTLASTGDSRIIGSLMNAQAIVGYAPATFEPIFIYSPAERKMVWRDPRKYALMQHETHETQKDYLRKPALSKNVQAEMVAALRAAMGL